MSRLTDRLERDLREVAAGARPSPSAWETIVARLGDTAEPEVALVLAPTPTPGPTRSARTMWLAVAAALVVIAGSVAVLSTAGDDESISAADLTTTLISPRNGFSIRHPEGASVRPAVQLWGWGEQVDDGFDVVEIDAGTVIKGTSREFPGDLPCLDDDYEPTACGTTDDRIDRDLLQDLPGGCGIPRGAQAEVTIDGQQGRVAECRGRIEATVVHGGRLYVFILVHDRSNARAVFDVIAATIDLTPETGVDFLGLTETFVSPTYGFTFGYIRGIRPATNRWDPDNQPPGDRNLDHRFDAVETGYGAYLEGASTKLPDGVSVDGWVDEHVTPRTAGGCGVPRDQQAEVTIDGQSGRVAACANQIEATVVAGGRLYLFVVYRDGRDAMALFDAWIATIDLTPETAADP